MLTALHMKPNSGCTAKRATQTITITSTAALSPPKAGRDCSTGTHAHHFVDAGVCSVVVSKEGSVAGPAADADVVKVSPAVHARSYFCCLAGTTASACEHYRKVQSTTRKLGNTRASGPREQRQRTGSGSTWVSVETRRPVSRNTCSWREFQQESHR